MSFQAYLDNIEAKIGKTPQQLLDEARVHGFDASTKASEIIQWLADEYRLGRGHAMAVVHVIRNGATISEKHVNSGGVHSDSSAILNLNGKEK